MSKYISRGSEWRKWDLHVHTQGTMKNDQFDSSDFNSFCITMFRKAIENNVAAIGITDYFNIDKYKEVKQFVENIDKHPDCTDEEKNKIKNIFILPNVELRMIPATDSGRLINIHCLFNPRYTLNLENDFFSSLEHDGYKMNRQGLIDLGKSMYKPTIIDDNIAYKKGIENFVITPESLQNLLNNKHELRENLLVVVSNSSNDGASGLQNHYTLFENEPGNLDSVRKIIYKLSDAIFSGNENDRKFFLGQKAGSNEQVVTQKCGSLKPCIHGSDAHTEGALFSPTDNKYCWIKADLTFEGLRQILYEPEDRVRIQASNPDNKESYQIIDCVQFYNSDFMTSKIPISQNLTAIIGGKSTGKSILLGTVSTTIHPEEVNNRLKEVHGDNYDKMNNSIENFKVTWMDGQENTTLKKHDGVSDDDNSNANKNIIYIPQSYLNRLVEDEEEGESIHKIIENVLKQDKREVYARLADLERKNNQEIATKIASLFSHIESFEEQVKKLKEFGDKKGVQIEIDKLENEITELKKTAGMSNNEIEQYNNFVKKIQEIENNIRQMGLDQQQLTELIDIDLFYEPDLSQLSEEIKNDTAVFYQELIAETQQKWEGFINEKLNDLSNHLQSNQDSLRETNENFKPLLQKAIQFHFLREKIDQIKVQQDKMEDILIREKAKETTIKAVNEIIQNLIQLSGSFYDIYNQEQEEIVSQSIISNDLEFNLSVQLKTQSFKKDFINKIFDNRRLPKELSEYQYKDNNDFSEKVRSLIIGILREKIFLKTGHTKNEALTILLRNWYKYDYQITQGSDDISQMSPGKRSLVLLKLLIELDNSKCPILLDQPEDDLDNRSIYNDLVKFIKNKKRERQIIVVTHNPNLVVGADAECVIVANQRGAHSENKNYKFEYVSGALENTFFENYEDKILYKQGIREHVCDILEGGNEAFVKREKKYGMTNRS